jgi:hypothetical protein
LSLFSPGQADPNFTFRNSACFSIIEQPSLMSSVITFPPKNYCSVTDDAVFENGQIGCSATDIDKRDSGFFSSWLKTASAEASGSKVNPDNSMPELWMHLPTLRIDEA